MKKILKKIGNFFGTFLFPRKMANYTKMSLFFGFLLFLCCILVSSASANMHAEEYVVDLYGDLFFIDQTKHNYQLVEGSADLPELELVKDTSGGYHYAICENFPIVNETPQHVFDLVLKDSKDQKSTLFLKVVYELEYYEEKASDKPAIPERFQGTYLVYENETRHIIEVLADGKGYYDGKKANFSFDSETNSIASETEKLTIVITTDESNNYVVQVKTADASLSITSTTRLFSKNVLKNFDFYQYLQEDVNLGENEDELLIIFTRTLIYPLYNRGRAPLDGQKDFNYLETTDKKGNPTHFIYQYYLPDEGDIFSDPTTWTEPSAYGKTKEINGVTYTAYPKATIDSLAEIFAYNTPVLSYEYANNMKMNITTTKADSLVQILTNYLIESWASSAKYQNSCAAGLPFGFLLPLLCILITWLMSRKKGVLKTFKEYFNLAALSYVLPAVVCFILGFFFQYTQFVYFTLLFQLGFYIFAAYRINSASIETYPNNNNNPSNGTLKVDSTNESGEEAKSTDNEPKESNNEDNLSDNLSDNSSNFIG